MAEIPPPGTQLNGGPPASAPTPTQNNNLTTSKRQRRPSVRLGDIGDHTYDLHFNRRHQWKMPPPKSSKVRNLMNLSGEDKEGNLDIVAIGSWKGTDSKPKRNTKRIRSNWISKAPHDNNVSAGEEDVDDGFRDFEPQGSESPLKGGNSPINSVDDLPLDVDKQNNGPKRGGGGVRSRVSDSRDHHQLEAPSPSDTNWNNFERNGVRVWLNQLGLGRYAPVFEIHEVDDQVLPMLTLEDLKDMGINAVGSRRKMFYAIQKLGKGFS